MKYWVIAALYLLLCLAGCDLAKDTGKTAEQGGQGATGLADKMSGGTIGNTDEETGEAAGDEDTGATGGASDSAAEDGT